MRNNEVLKRLISVILFVSVVFSCGADAFASYYASAEAAESRTAAFEETARNAEDSRNGSALQPDDVLPANETAADPEEEISADQPVPGDDETGSHDGADLLPDNELPENETLTDPEILIPADEAAACDEEDHSQEEEPGKTDADALTENEVIPAAADETEEFITEEDNTDNRPYYYEYSCNDGIVIKAFPENRNAFPEGTSFRAERVTAGSENRNYNAFMNALNMRGITAYLLDLSFFAPEIDAAGEMTGNVTECEPAEGNVTVTVRFPEGSVKKNSEVKVTHLPLTAEARLIAGSSAGNAFTDADDIRNEPVGSVSVDWETNTVSFAADSFSVYAITFAASGSRRMLGAPAPGGYTVKPVFTDYDGTSPYDPGVLSGSYYVLVEATKKSTGETLYAVKNAKDSDGNILSEVVISVHGFVPVNENFGGETSNGNNSAYDYDPDNFEITSVRLLKVPQNGGLYSYETAKKGVAPEGFEFSGRTDGQDSATLTYKRAYGKEYGVRFVFDSDSMDLPASELFYVFLEATGENNQKYYYLEKLDLSSSDLKTGADGKQYYEIPVSAWQDNNGNSVSYTFTGNETVSVSILKANLEINMNSATNHTNCMVIGEGEYLNGYKVSYGSRGTEKDDTSHIDKMYENVLLSKINATYDYNFVSVLGPSLNYGITADHFEQKMHIQTNFAVNLYTNPNGQNATEPDLTGISSGVVVVGEFDGDSQLFIGISHLGNIIFYADSAKTDPLKDPRDFVYTVKEPGSDLKRDMVEPGIQHGDDISAELLTYDPTFQPSLPKESDYLDINTLNLPTDATIYLDGDTLLPWISNTGKLRLTKHPDQMIVFNFDSSDSVTIDQIAVRFSENDDYQDSTSPTDQGDKNTWLGNVAKNIVWNCASCKNVDIQMGTGIFLVPRDDSTTDIVGTSSGWIVSDGYVKNSGGEWHALYGEMPNTDTATLYASKKVNGKDPGAAQKFTFVFEHFVNGSWVELRRVENDGSSVNCTINELTPGWNVYRITETGPSAGTEGYFASNTQTYYAVVKFNVTNQGAENEIKTAELPKYYSSFDESAFDPDSLTSSAWVSGQVTKPEFLNEMKNNSLSIRKAVIGTDDGTRFAFTICLNYPAGSVTGTRASFDCNIGGVVSPLTFENGKATLLLGAGQTAVISGLPAGTLYSVSEEDCENYVLSETSGTLGTIATDGTASASFTNKKYDGTCKISLQAEKRIAGRDWNTGDSFTFTLEADSSNPDAPLPDATGRAVTVTSSDRTASFGEISFTEPGIYKYVIKEDLSNKISGLIYDETPHEAVVTVAKVSGKLVAYVKYDDLDSLTVTNRCTGVVAQIKATKTLSGRSWKDGDSFEFTLSAVTDGAPMPAAGGDKGNATSAAPEVTFGEITYTAPGTYIYAVTETEGNIPGIQYDTSAHEVTVEVKEGSGGLTASVSYGAEKELVITNAFSTTCAETLFVTKAFNDWGKATGFDFTLTSDDPDTPMPSETTATVTESNQQAQFGPITYSAPGVYTYAITETDSGVPGIVCDTAAHTAVVTVTKDDTTGNLSASVKYDGNQDSLTVTNRYTGTVAQIKATKSFTGRAWKDSDAFAFTLSAKTDGAPMPAPGGETGTATSAAPEVTFGEITYTAPGTYTYLVKETKGNIPNVTYDDKTHTATVTVEKDDATGNLTASVKYDGTEDALTVTNSFYSECEDTLDAKKLFVTPMGVTLPLAAGRFTFSFTVSSGQNYGDAVDVSNLKESASNASNGDISFGKIKFKKAGTYVFTVKEDTKDGSGVTVDKTQFTVTFTVTADSDGILSVSKTISNGTNDVDKIVFRNTYEADPDVIIKGRKNLSGRDFKDGDRLLVTVTSDDCTKLPSPSVLDVPLPVGENTKTFEFNPVSFDESDMAGIEKDQDGLLTRVIHYTVTETAVMDHVISDTRTHTVTVTLQDDLYGNMYAFVTYSDGDQVELNNKYTADCRIAPSVTKVLTGRAWQATDSFEFKLSPITDNAPLPAAGTETVTVTAADKTFEFGLITFTEPGTYEYEISEVTPDAQKLPGVTYDSSKHRVTITVTEDPSSSELNATLKYDYAAADCLTVTNAYHSKGQFSLQAVKEIAGSNKPGFTSMFTFQLFNEQGVKIDEKKLSFNANETSWSKTVTFDPISVSEEDIFLTSGSDTAEFVYTVKEYIPEGAKPNEPRGSYIYDFTEYTVHVLLKDNGDGTITATQTESPADVKFVNIYGAMGSIRLEARKVLTGETLREGEFTFLLKDQNGTVLQRKTNSADGKVVFDPIAYTEADLGSDGKATLNYTISELEGSNSKFTYDSSVCNVAVSLTATQDDSIIATATYDNASAFRTFTNKAGASGKVLLGATKKLSGEKLKAGSFSFQLKDSTGKILQTKKNDSAGNVTFDEITYTLDDVAKSPIRYTISEQAGSSGKYIYDAKVYDVLVTLTDNNDGTITATPDKKSIEISFTNTARAIGSVSLKATKVLKGSTLQNGEFTFILKDSAGNILQKKTNDASGNIAFDPISYTLADLPNSPITYTISEEKGSEEGILYDEDVITVKVTLTDNGDGTITATPDLTGKDLQFVNWAWHSPLTGDKADPVSLFALFAMSGSFLVCAVAHRKKRKGRL